MMMPGMRRTMVAEELEAGGGDCVAIVAIDHDRVDFDHICRACAQMRENAPDIAVDLLRLRAGVADADPLVVLIARNLARDNR